MKKEKISEIISLTDDRFIAEAATVKKKHTHIFRYAGIAACLAAAVTAAALISQSDFIKPAPEIIIDATSNESGGGDKTVQEIATTPAIYYDPTENTEIGEEIEMAIVPKWEDRKTQEKYSELMLGKTTYASQLADIGEEHIDEFITDATMSGYDIYSDKTYTVDAKVYSIRNISKNCAVAAKIGDEDTYFIYINVWYEPDSLGDFISDLNLKNTVSFGKAYIDIYKYDSLSTSHTEIIYADFDDNVIWDMLTDVTDAKNVEYNHPYDRIGIETNLPLLGYKNISFCVTPDGYIITNILGTQKCFFIGTEKFEAFDKYLKDNVPSKQIDNTYEVAPDGAMPGKGDSGETIPGYNPQAEVTSPPYNPETDPVPPVAPSVDTPLTAPDGIITEQTTAMN